MFIEYLHCLHKGIRGYRFALQEATKETLLGDMIGIFRMFTIGCWAYLSCIIVGQNYSKDPNHYNPKALVFSGRKYGDIAVSEVGVATAFGLLSTFEYMFGLASVLRYYVCPCMIVNMWLGLITLLQHSDPAIPH